MQLLRIVHWWDRDFWFVEVPSGYQAGIFDFRDGFQPAGNLNDPMIWFQIRSILVSFSLKNVIIMIFAVWLPTQCVFEQNKPLYSYLSHPYSVCSVCVWACVCSTKRRANLLCCTTSLLWRGLWTTASAKCKLKCTRGLRVSTLSTSRRSGDPRLRLSHLHLKHRNHSVDNRFPLISQLSGRENKQAVWKLIQTAITAQSKPWSKVFHLTSAIRVLISNC